MSWILEKSYATKLRSTGRRRGKRERAVTELHLGWQLKAVYLSRLEPVHHGCHSIATDRSRGGTTPNGWCVGKEVPVS